MGTMYRDSEDATWSFYLPSPAECESDAEYEACVEEWDSYAKDIAIIATLWQESYSPSGAGLAE